MIGRLVAWACVLAVCGAIWQYGSQWRSPWAVTPSQSVLTMLPAPHSGCKENCK